MINKDLETTNVVVKAINEKYPVAKWLGNIPHEDNSFVIYENTDEPWPVSLDEMKYMATIVAIDDNHVVWNSTKYAINNVDTLLQSIIFYNETLDFPAWTSNPQYVSGYNYISQISWYLTTKLGMKYNANNRCYYAGNENLPLYSVSIETDMYKQGNILIYHTIFGSKLYESSNNIKEVCNNIGTLYIAAVADTVNIATDCVNNLPEDTELTGCGNIKVWDSNTWDFLSAKDTLINKISEILEKLKNS